MNVQVIDMAPITVIAIKHRGPYDGLSAKFDQLWEWVERHGVPAQRTIGIYWDNPDFTPSGQLRSAACVEVPTSYLIDSTDGLPLDVSGIAGGQYATTTHTGPYESLERVWTSLTEHVENALGRTISEARPAFEVYVNDAATTAPNDLITELYMPLD